MSHTICIILHRLLESIFYLTVCVSRTRRMYASRSLVIFQRNYKFSRHNFVFHLLLFVNFLFNFLLSSWHFFRSDARMLTSKRCTEFSVVAIVVVAFVVSKPKMIYHEFGNATYCISCSSKKLLCRREFVEWQMRCNSSLSLFHFLILCNICK